MSALQITIFSDFTCPFCYVTEAALRARAASGGIEVRSRALELFPAPADLVSPAGQQGWEEQVRPLAEELSLPLRVPAFRPRTRKAHEAAVFAAQRGLGPQMRAAVFSAYWAEERDIGRIDVLLELASGIGIDEEDLRIALDIDLHRDAVLHDQAVARQLRITSAPTLFLGTGPGARILVGAQSAAALDAEIESCNKGRLS